MKLKDLFVSYQGVKPVSFKRNEISDEVPQYLNLDRAKKVTSDNTESTVWKVQDSDQNDDSKADNQLTSTVWQNPYSNNKTQWIIDMTNAYKTLGLSDKAIKNLIAKNALESGWGKFAYGDFNFGNITTGNKWGGRYVEGKDKDQNGSQVVQKYRAYNSLQDYILDELKLLTNLYDFNQNDDFETFIDKLSGNNKYKKKYAVAKDYKDRVRNVYKNL